MATLKNTTFQGTGNIKLPTGTTAERPAGGAGMIRYNTSMGILEFFDNGWRPVTGFAQGSIGTGGDSVYYRDGTIVHMFTSVAFTTFTPAHSGTVQVLVVAGGGSGGSHHGGGGGGGGVIYQKDFPVTAGTPYPISVGAGATRPSFPSRGNRGSSSFFNGPGGISVTGGGGGGSWNGSTAQPGGSGGGGDSSSSNRNRREGGRGITGQGFDGGTGIRFNSSGDNNHATGGGGGAGGRGRDGQEQRHDGRIAHGGPGMACDITGEVLYWGGGGGAAHHHGQQGVAATGGVGGGGAGMNYHGVPTYPASRVFAVGGGQALNAGGNSTSQSNAGNGGTNTGGGGGGVNYQYAGTGSAGGPGIVVVRY